MHEKDGGYVRDLHERRQAKINGRTANAEVEAGNVEYKFRLVDVKPHRFEHLVSQLLWRLAEGAGRSLNASSSSSARELEMHSHGNSTSCSASAAYRSS